MSFSKIDICNIALSNIGEGVIQSFDDNNRRARLCSVLYEPHKLAMLTELDWTFARRFKQLQEVSDPVNTESTDITPDLYTYTLPSDCLVARDLYPEGSQDFWKVVGRYLQCKKTYDEGVYLYYTTYEVSPADFSHSFCMVVAASMATVLAPSLKQDMKLTTAMLTMLDRMKIDAFTSDANIGNHYREYDGNPENDTFVNVG